MRHGQRTSWGLVGGISVRLIPGAVFWGRETKILLKFLQYNEHHDTIILLAVCCANDARHNCRMLSRKSLAWRPPKVDRRTL